MRSWSTVGENGPGASSGCQEGPGAVRQAQSKRAEIRVRPGFGTAVNLLRIERLTPEEFSTDIVKRLSPQGWLDGFDTGLHTLSDGGGVTLIDVRRVERKPMRHLIKLQYWLRRRLEAMPS